MLYAMSDIHGCLEEFDKNLEYICFDSGDRLVLLGDYIDYGPESGQVLYRISELLETYGNERVVLLKGNHEQMLLDWIKEYMKPIREEMEILYFDSWLKNDASTGYNTFKTLVSEEHFKKIKEAEKSASFVSLNVKAVKFVMSDSKDLIRMISGMKLFYETDNQIFVHAGVNEDAGENWKLATSQDIFLGKYPAVKGSFYKTIISGHVGTATVSGNPDYHDMYYDGKSHYYIDGSVYKGGKIVLLSYDEKDGSYRQVN